MKRKFSKTWNRSKQPRKQRKYRYNAPLNIKSKFLGCHLSKALREKYKKRSVVVRNGDSIKVLRGQFKGKTGKIDKVDIKKCKVYITGIEVSKKDGTKALYPIHPSNIVINELNLEDKHRKKILERR